jgi:hypothetical protein
MIDDDLDRVHQMQTEMRLAKMARLKQAEHKRRKEDTAKRHQHIARLTTVEDGRLRAHEFVWGKKPPTPQPPKPKPKPEPRSSKPFIARNGVLVGTVDIEGGVYYGQLYRGRP